MILPFPAPADQPSPRPVGPRRRARSASSGPAVGRGRIVLCDEAGALVVTRAGTIRATWGAQVLCARAADPDAVPRAGQVVDWFRWPDRRVTVERVHPAA